MVKKVEALVTPVVLRWARNTAGYDLTDVAHRLKVSEEQINAWEEGTLKPSVAQARKLAGLYKRNVALFYLDTPPTEPSPITDYRRLVDKNSRGISIELLYEIRNARENRAVALELQGRLGDPIRNFELNCSIEEDPEVVGYRLREYFGVEARNGKIKNYNLRDWRHIFESRGVLIFQMRSYAKAHVEVEEARAFSLGERPLPVIVINPRDAENGRIFSMFHEVTHLALSQGGICQPGLLEEEKTGRSGVEAFCNRVAGAALMPEKFIAGEELVQEKMRSRTIWGEDEVGVLARRYKVSAASVLVRLVHLRIISRDVYAPLSNEIERKFLAYKAAQKPKDIRLKPQDVAINKVGKGYANLILWGLSEDLLTEVEASNYLNRVDVSCLKKIEARIYQESHHPT